MIFRTSDLDVRDRRCVLFDFDGTLADTKPTIIKTALDVLKDWDIPPERLARVDEIVGPPFPEAFSMVFGVSEADAEEITRRYRAIYNTLGQEAWPLFDGTKEMLTALHVGGKLVGVASSKREESVFKAIDDNDARALFDVVVGRRPPLITSKTGAMNAVLDVLGCTTEDAVMVGDRFHDVEAALELGIPCVGVLFGNTATREELTGAGAFAVVDTMDELQSVLLG